MLNEHGDLIFMNPRTELEMLRSELREIEKEIKKNKSPEVDNALWESKLVTIERMAVLERHMGFENWERRVLETKKEYFEKWLNSNYEEHPDSEAMLGKYQRVCDRLDKKSP